jgi:hypothetical protein
MNYFNSYLGDNVNHNALAIAQLPNPTNLQLNHFDLFGDIVNSTGKERGNQ